MRASSATGLAILAVLAAASLTQAAIPLAAWSSRPGAFPNASLVRDAAPYAPLQLLQTHLGALRGDLTVLVVASELGTQELARAADAYGDGSRSVVPFLQHVMSQSASSLSVPSVQTGTGRVLAAELAAAGAAVTTVKCIDEVTLGTALAASDFDAETTLLIVDARTTSAAVLDDVLKAVDRAVSAKMGAKAHFSVIVTANESSDRELPQVLEPASRKPMSRERRELGNDPAIATAEKMYVYFTATTFMILGVVFLLVTMTLLGVYALSTTQTPDKFADANKDKNLTVPQ